MRSRHSAVCVCVCVCVQGDSDAECDDGVDWMKFVSESEYQLRPYQGSSEVRLSEFGVCRMEVRESHRPMVRVCMNSGMNGARGTDGLTPSHPNINSH